ncbi:MAG: DNA repair protein RecN [Fimbriimonadia bacterium]|nr:DNA repair protein RecN [Fimbriimonadia bacterium]
MLLELHIENLAIIERVDLTFGEGFNVLTGETGAGKSILLDAIGLVLGDRADPHMVRAGANRALVQAVFDLSQYPDDMGDLLSESGIELEEGLLYLTRELHASGRSIARVNGQPVPLQVVKALGDALVDLHGQHEHQSLLRTQTHLDFLDRWLGEHVMSLRAKTRESVQRVHALQREWDELNAREREREQLLDLYQFQIAEIENAQLQPGEEESLLTEERRLTHAEKLRNLSGSGYESLMGESGAYDRVAEALRNLEEIARIDPSMEPQREELQGALIQIEESGRALRDYLENVEYDPERLEEVVARIETIKRLKRKYGDTLGEVINFGEELRRKLDDLSNQQARREEIEAERVSAEKELDALVEELSQHRHQGAKRFSELVQAELHDLAMDRALFEANIQAQSIDSTGKDKIEFLLTPNPGEPLKPLNKIASGGEMSRVMLALKTALSHTSPVPTLIFDEVDAGLGGKTALKVGEKIADLQTDFQIICVTHLAQIACKAKQHYQITKLTEDERTLVQVGPLSDEERVLELARMLAGEPTDTALQHARELLEKPVTHGA